ncbi:MAG: RNase adapter RapZ, partial [Bauldia litoralis]
MTIHPPAEAPARPDGLTAEPAAATLLLVTGLSGAGKSTALQALEDAGFEVVDNLPVSLLGALVQPGTPRDRPIAIGVDVRTRDFGGAPFFERLSSVAAATGVSIRIIFLDCDDEVIVRRYSQTRRRHPLAGA